MWINRGLFIVVSCLPALAFADETAAPNAVAPAVSPPAPAPAPAPTAPPAVTPAHDGPADGLQLQARLPMQFGVSSLLSPGFTIAYRMGRFAIGGELGLLAGKLTNGNTIDSFYLVHLMPVVYVDIWQSVDGRARLGVVGGIGFGRGKVSSETTNMMITSTSDETANYIPILLGLGGDYFLHPNFALGVELGAELPILSGVVNNGIDQSVSGGVQSLRGMIRVTFVAGR